MKLLLFQAAYDAVVVVPHLAETLAEILANSVLPRPSNFSTRAIRLAITVAALVSPAAVALASRACALGNQVVALPSSRVMRAASFSALAHRAARVAGVTVAGVVDGCVVDVASPTSPILQLRQ
jgi:hypothetical protein